MTIRLTIATGAVRKASNRVFHVITDPAKRMFRNHRARRARRRVARALGAAGSAAMTAALTAGTAALVTELARSRRAA